MTIASPLRRGTILVIDDDPAINNTFVRMLTLEGHVAHAVRDGETGLQTLDDLAPDAILVDLRMPDVDGLEFLRRLRAQPLHRDTPIAIVTGDHSIDEAVVEELASLGASVHFKPVWCSDLLRIAEDLLRTAPDALRFPNQTQTFRPDDAPQRRTLLLVDDCAAQRDLYEMALQRHFNILTASRGDEGVTIASQERPDAIVLDVTMPGLDGWQTCRRLKSDANTASIPVIFLTSLDDVDLATQAIDVGGSVLLHKPCPAEDLLNTICSTLLMHGEP